MNKNITHTLIVRGVPKQVKNRLKRQARGEGRSVNYIILDLLISRYGDNEKRMKEIFKEYGEMMAEKYP